jgi:hypothetical protein
MTVDLTTCAPTLRLKVKSEAYPWLDAAAIEINQVWNYANATSYKALRPFTGPGRWLSGFDLDKLTAGAAKHFERISHAVLRRIPRHGATLQSEAKGAYRGGANSSVELKNGVAFEGRRRRDIAPAGELAGLPARDSPKPLTFAGPPQGMTYTAKNFGTSGVLFVTSNVIFIT